jgi:hypothetical protein
MKYFAATSPEHGSFLLPGESGGDLIEVSYPHIIVHYEHRSWNGVQYCLVRGIVAEIHGHPEARMRLRPILRILLLSGHRKLIRQLLDIRALNVPEVNPGTTSFGAELRRLPAKYPQSDFAESSLHPHLAHWN